MHKVFFNTYKNGFHYQRTYENNNIEVIVDDNGTLWLNQKHIEEKLGHKNLTVITNRYDLIYRNHRYELVEPKKQPSRIYLLDKLAKILIMERKTDKSCNFKRKLGFNLHDVINTKEKQY